MAEFIHGYAVDINGEPPHLDREAQTVDIDSLRDICLGLIETAQNEDDEGHDTITVRISHFSVQEYLQSDRIQQAKARIFALRSGPSHAEIAQICLVYLLETMLSNVEADETKLTEFPLARYAAMCWFRHYINSLDGNSNVKTLVRKLFNDEKGSFRTSIRIHDVDRPWEERAV